MGNLDLYRRYSQPPKEALKTIKGGRLNGYTDINPMWRIMALTEAYGPCGIGWTYTIDRQWLETGANGEVSAFCNISLYVKAGDVWGKGIPGTGGASFVAKERNGLYTSDECYKMALTDAISVACKALGFGADVYWEGGRTKYDQPKGRGKDNQADDGPGETLICEQCGGPVVDMTGKDGGIIPAEQVAEISLKKHGRTLCGECQIKLKRRGRSETINQDAGQ